MVIIESRADHKAAPTWRHSNLVTKLRTKKRTRNFGSFWFVAGNFPYSRFPSPQVDRGNRIALRGRCIDERVHHVDRGRTENERSSVKRRRGSNGSSRRNVEAAGG